MATELDLLVCGPAVSVCARQAAGRFRGPIYQRHDRRRPEFHVPSKSTQAFASRWTAPGIVVVATFSCWLCCATDAGTYVLRTRRRAVSFTRRRRSESSASAVSIDRASSAARLAGPCLFARRWPRNDCNVPPVLPGIQLLCVKN
jgi:hypothetical protein